MATREHAGHPGRTALIIEDDKLMAHLLRLVLQKEGYAVHRVADGRAARQFVAQEPACDLVTLDFMLPDATGLQLLRRLRASKGWNDVPVLILTAHTQENGDLALALQSSPVAYLEKPFSVEDLRAGIWRLTGETAHARPLNRSMAEGLAPLAGRC